jgi:predicted transcriptional regulator
MANHKRKEPVVRVTVGIDLADHERLSKMADEAGVSLSWIVRRATRDFLARKQPTNLAKGLGVSPRPRMRARK